MPKPQASVNDTATFPFCSPVALVASTTSAVALRDAFPLGEGHTLVVPRRHVASLFELTAAVSSITNAVIRNRGRI